MPASELSLKSRKSKEKCKGLPTLPHPPVTPAAMAGISAAHPPASLDVLQWPHADFTKSVNVPSAVNVASTASVVEKRHVTDTTCIAKNTNVIKPTNIPEFLVAASPTGS